VAGVDGCRGGWVVAHADGCELVSAFAPLLDRFDVLGVDMPIGLPERWGRSADAQARRFLAPRGSTVFPVPPRALLDHDDYALANATSRESFGQGLTRQTFHLFPKLRELDALMTPAIAERVVEIHPECAFARLGGHPLPPKRSGAGRAERRRLLEAVFGSLARPTRVPEHDVLDAYAVLWSAHRFANGVADVFGAEERDAKGLPMRIVS
jgi:predicted RNase H-like nuclease